MTGTSLADRGRGLEDAFFAKQDAMLRRRLADLDDGRSRKAALMQASGISDEAALDKLVALGISSTLLAAISLVPLVAVAWADGDIDAQERQLLLAGATQAGLDEAHPGHALLEGWLDRKPSALLFETWSAYMSALMPTLAEDERHALRTQILGRTRAVADAAGGFLRLTPKTSAAENHVLREVTQVLSA